MKHKMFLFIAMCVFQYCLMLSEMNGQSVPYICDGPLTTTNNLFTAVVVIEYEHVIAAVKWFTAAGVKFISRQPGSANNIS